MPGSVDFFHFSFSLSGGFLMAKDLSIRYSTARATAVPTQSKHVDMSIYDLSQQGDLENMAVGIAVRLLVHLPLHTVPPDTLQIRPEAHVSCDRMEFFRELIACFPCLDRL